MQTFLRFTATVLVLVGTLCSLKGQCDDPNTPGGGSFNCDTAPVFCTEGEFDGFCSYTTAGGGTTTPSGFCGSVENNQWIAFVAGGVTTVLDLTVSSCDGTPTGTGLQAQIYETSDCLVFNAVSNCYSPGTQGTGTITATGLTPGQTYYLMIDGWAGDQCDFEIGVVQGVGSPPLPQLNGPISGVTEVCPGSTLSYSIPEGMNIDEYEWQIQGGLSGTINNGQGSNMVDVTWNNAGGGQLCVTGSNTCGDITQPVCIFITSQPIINPPVISDPICIGSCFEFEGMQFCNPGTFPINYTSWLGCDSIIDVIIPSVIPPVFTDEEVIICAPDCYDFDGNTYCTSNGFQGQFTSFNTGCDSFHTVTLYVLEANADIATPMNLPCGSTASTFLDASGSTQTTVSTNANLTYTWAATNGGTILDESDPLNVEVGSAGDYTITVTQELNGTTCTNDFTVTVNQASGSTDAPTLDGPTSVCPNELSLYTVTTIDGNATGLIVTTPNGESFNINSNTEFDVTWDAGAGGNLCVIAQSSCGDSDETCIAVNFAEGPEDPAIDGEIAPCAEPGYIYSITPFDANNTYNWAVPSGATFNDNGDNITVDMTNASSGDICVTAENDCGAGNEICFPITISPNPQDPTIAGDNNLCASEIGTYTVTNEANVTFNWIAPNGEAITGQGTNEITIDWAASTGGQVCVSAENDCATSAQDCFDVTINAAPTAEISGDGAFCEGSGDEVTITIELTGQSPWELVYAIDGNDEPIETITASPFTFDVDAAGEYTITSVIDAGGCPGTLNGMATVTQNDAPTATLSGSGSICAGSGDCVDLMIELTGTAPWAVEYALDGTTQAPVNIDNANDVINVCQTGEYTLISVTDDNGCAGTFSGTVIVEENTAPTVTNIATTCNGTGTAYTVTFEITGGTTPYDIAPNTGTVDGAGIFTSAEIPSGDGYSFIVTDVNDCDPVTIEDAEVICACDTQVGTMDVTEMTECGTACITPTYDNTNENLDPDDVIQFILHEGNALTIVNEIARNLTTEFCFDDATMTYGSTYYISAAVGNDDGNGDVALADGCTAIAQGTPVVWNEIPTATMANNMTICEDETATLTINLTGGAPYSVTYNDGVNDIPLNGINNDTYELEVTPSATTTYCLVDVSTATCTNTATDCVEVIVNGSPSVSAASTTCNATGTAFVVTFEISGGDAASYEVLPAGSGTISAAAPFIFTSNEIPAGDTYAFDVQDGNACDVIIVETMTPVICDCNTDVGTMNTTPVEICGDGMVSADYDNGETFDGDDILEYILHDASGNNIGAIIDQNQTGDFAFDGANMNYGTTYYLSAVVGNDSSDGTTVDLSDQCTQVAVGTPITWNEIPTATMSGDATVCAGETVLVTIDFTGQGPWSITYTEGGVETTETVNSSPLIIDMEATTNMVCVPVSVENANCVGTVSGGAMITVNDAPTATAASTTCNATGTAFVVTFEISGGDAASYEVLPAGFGTISAAAPFIFTSNEIPAGDTYAFDVQDGNACDVITVETMTPVICDCNTDVGTMNTTPVEICGDGMVSADYDNGETFDGDDILEYILHDASGNNIGAIIDQNQTGDFAFDGANMNYGTTYYLSAVVGNDSGDGTTVDLSDQCTQVAVGTPITWNEIPTATLGADAAICLGEMATISIDLTGISPWTLVYNDGTNDITEMNITASPFTIDVNPIVTTTYTPVSVADAHCDGTASDSATITVNEAPTVSNIDVQFNATNTAYTVCFDINGGTAPYTVMGGTGTVTGNQFCSDEILCGQGYDFNVDDNNACGPTNVTQAQVVCNCDTNAGTMAAMPLFACGDGPIMGEYLGGETLDGNDIVSYILHDGNTSAPIASNTTPEFNFLAGTMTYGTSYFISAAAGDDDGNGIADPTDPCVSYSVGQEIVFFDPPVATLMGMEEICAGECVDLAIQIVGGTAPWDITYNDGTTSTTITANSSPYTLNVCPTTDATYTLESITDANCVGMATGSAMVTVNSTPMATNIQVNIDPTNTFYTITFDIMGGDMATYMVTGNTGTLTGLSFVSDQLSCDDAYNFILSDAGGCSTDEVSGTVDCNCTTDAGTMQVNALQGYCDGETASAIFNNDEVLDGNDGLTYILHTQGGNTLGDIVGTNATAPEFTFDGGTMSYDVTYYISAVAGDDLGGTIDLTDGCLSVALGVPIVFYELPTFMLNGDQTICESDAASIEVNATGLAPFTIMYNDGIMDITEMNVNNGYQITQNFTTTTTYTAIAITDTNGCSNTSNSTALVEVNTPPNAGSVADDFEYCEGENEVINLNAALVGADAGGNWTVTPSIAGFNPNNVNIATLAVADYTFTYTIDGTAPCPNASTTADLAVNPSPTADAGIDAELDCDENSTTLGGPNSTTGGTIEYVWTNALNEQVGNTATIPDWTQEGSYLLTVIDTETNCSATDIVDVMSSMDMPSLSLTVSPTTCFGDSDGGISIDTVFGGTPPYSYSLNGGAFTQTTNFFNLDGGTYEITVQDANFCTSVLEITVEEAQEITVNLVDDLGEENTLILGDSVTLEVLNNLDSVAFVTWQPEGSVPCDTCLLQVIYPQQTTTYSVTIGDVNGCTETDILEVIVDRNREIFVPQIFSPNGDNMNDVFFINASAKVANIESFLIYNRWGETIYSYSNFTPNDPASGWDGTHRGQSCNPAVYVWYAKVEYVDGRIEFFEGDITLVRY